MKTSNALINHELIIILIDEIDLFVWGFSSHSRIFHSNGDVTITSELLQILTYTLALIAIEQ